MADNNITTFIRCLVAPMQRFEDAVQAILFQRFIDNAVGAQLDLLGKLVRQSRNGLEDVDYRRYIRARIVANKSDGLMEDVLMVVRLIINDTDTHIHARNNGNATITVTLEDNATPDELAEIVIDFLRTPTVSGGVRVILQSSSQDPAAWFRWDTPGVGWDEGKFVYSKD